MIPPVTSHLFQIATRRRKCHENPAVIIPAGEGKPIQKELLITGKNRSVLELGAGSGEFALQWMSENRDDSYVAFEIKPERIYKILKQIDKRHIENLKVVPINFNWFLPEILPAETFDIVIINFPDPWPKKRHRKHRLVNDAFPERLRPLLSPGAVVHLATDYGPYARQMLRVFRRSPLFEPVFPFPNYLRKRPDGWPETKFEQLHISEGKRPYYQRWKLVDRNGTEETG